MLNESEKKIVLKAMRKMRKRHTDDEIREKLMDMFDFMMESLYSSMNLTATEDGENHD